jgi:hypothetical protein
LNDEQTNWFDRMGNHSPSVSLYRNYIGLFGITEMNERIRELAEQAGAVFEKTNGLNDCPQDSLVGDEIQKFAELIVKECIVTLKRQECIDKLKQHFGVEE